MNRVGVALALVLAGGLLLLPTVSWAGSMPSVIVSGGALHVTARGAAAAGVAIGGFLILGGSTRTARFGVSRLEWPSFPSEVLGPLLVHVCDGRLGVTLESV